MRTTLLCIAATLSLAAITASGMDPATNRNAANKESPRSSNGFSHKTLFLDLKLYGCDGDTGKRINRQFRGRLDSLKNCELLGHGPAGVPPCDSADCAREYGKTAGAHRALYGYVSLTTNIEKARLGTTGLEKYIVKTEKHKSYTIITKLLDVETGEILAAIEKKSSPEDLDRTIGDMSAELAPYFTPRETVKTAEEPKKPEEKPASSVKYRDFFPRMYQLGCAFSFMAPVGDFRDVTTFASGAAIEARIGGAPALANLELRPLLGFYFYAAEDESVDSYRSLYLSLSAGYRFRLYRGITATPLFGGGYILHFVESDAGSARYSDPLLSLRVGLDYGVYPGLSLSVAPGYILFFEQGGIGMYPVFDLGIAYSF